MFFFSTEVTLNPPCVAFIDTICFDCYVLFKNPCVHKLLSVQTFFSDKETDSPITPDNQKIEKTLDAVYKLNPEQPAQNSSKQRTRVSLPAFLVGFDEDSKSLVVKSVPSVFTAIQQHKAQFVGACVLRGSKEFSFVQNRYSSQEYHAAPNRSSYCLNTDCATMHNHNLKFKKFPRSAPQSL